MKAKINIAAILKGKPHGIRLYSPIFGECVFCYVREVTDDICVKHNGEKAFFNSEGLYNILGEVMLFPSKSMQDWSKFSWKRGDVLVSNDGGTKVIFDKWYDDTYTNFYSKHYLNSEDENNIKYNEAFLCTTERYSLEDKDAAQSYINTIEKRLGGKLNLKTLEIEKYQPEFKDGDILSCDEDTYTKHTTLILHKNGCVVESLVSLIRHHDLVESREPINEVLLSRLYYAREDEKKELFDALAKEGKAWDAEKKQIVDLKPKVYFKPFDKVVVRNTEDSIWQADFFSHIDVDNRYACVGATWSFCIPYNEETAKLIGTTKDIKD